MKKSCGNCRHGGTPERVELPTGIVYQLPCLLNPPIVVARADGSLLSQPPVLLVSSKCSRHSYLNLIARLFLFWRSS